MENLRDAEIIITDEKYLETMKEVLTRLKVKEVKKLYRTKEVFGILDIASEERRGVEVKTRVKILKEYFGSLENASTVNEYTTDELFTILDAAVLGKIPTRAAVNSVYGLVSNGFDSFVSSVVFLASKSLTWPTKSVK